ncbi:hypothetical protein PoB_000378400 [Plakobranchus ocellatus]|uniref:Uncharacterized protein n=1 Tax=Plakobranchus ocellatus TaxID=259542 RepID=A0AAV3Y2P8_9GAST|nr:hypothetical protein PoB_000378400 [Plakobranchus ocellatus]
MLSTGEKTVPQGTVDWGRRNDRLTTSKTRPEKPFSETQDLTYDQDKWRGPKYKETSLGAWQGRKDNIMADELGLACYIHAHSTINRMTCVTTE